MKTAQKIVGKLEIKNEKYTGFVQRLNNGKLTCYESIMLKMPVIPNRIKKFKVLADNGINELPTYGLINALKSKIILLERNNNELSNQSAQKRFVELRKFLVMKEESFSAMLSAPQRVVNTANRAAEQFFIDTGIKCHVKDAAERAEVTMSGSELIEPTILAMLHAVSLSKNNRKAISLEVSTVRSRANETVYGLEITVSGEIYPELRYLFSKSAELMDGGFKVSDGVSKMTINLSEFSDHVELMHPKKRF